MGCRVDEKLVIIHVLWTENVLLGSNESIAKKPFTLSGNDSLCDSTTIYLYTRVVRCLLLNSHGLTKEFGREDLTRQSGSCSQFVTRHDSENRDFVVYLFSPFRIHNGHLVFFNWQVLRRWPRADLRRPEGQLPTLEEGDDVDQTSCRRHNDNGHDDGVGPPVPLVRIFGTLLSRRPCCHPLS